MSNKMVKRRRPQPAARGTRERIERALAANDIVTAARLAEAALAAGETDPMLLNLAAWRREETGDFDGAHHLLRRALAIAPGDVLVMTAIGAVMRKEGRYDEALTILGRVVAAESHYAVAWLERGYVLDALRADAQARESYERALALDPRLAPALGKLADMAARQGDRARGAALAREALALNPDEPAATFALATVENETAEAATARQRLTALLAAGVTGDDRTRTLTLLGDALDKLDRSAEAFRTWSEAQANFRTIYRPLLEPGPERPSHRTFIENIAAQVAAAPPMEVLLADAPVAGAAATHVFLLGYPRSGTTLVENVLASAPDVVALEERDTFADIDAALVANDGTMPPLDALDATLVNRLRTAYWERVQGFGAAVEGKVFVDMNPFNGIKLPIIARLFPRARILIMRRDPRDVILSCYRVNFTPSPAAWCFSGLEEAARHYDALTRLIEVCRERLPLAYHEVRYDRLVADFEPTVRGMANFVGLPWTENFKRFDRTAQRRGVRTASATQVRRGLYDGRNQWRRYADQLAPALPILAPWIERFGFDP